MAQRYRPDPMRRVPLLYGSRLVVADAGEDAVAIAPPSPPDEAIADVGAAVRDAFRFPLAGDSLETIVPRGGRATISPPGRVTRTRTDHPSPASLSYAPPRGDDHVWRGGHSRTAPRTDRLITPPSIAEGDQA